MAGLEATAAEKPLSHRLREGAAVSPPQPPLPLLPRRRMSRSTSSHLRRRDAKRSKSAWHCRKGLRAGGLSRLGYNRCFECLTLFFSDVEL